LLQADRRALNITLNSIGTELTRDDRRKLYANFGLLFPHGQVRPLAAVPTCCVAAPGAWLPGWWLGCGNGSACHAVCMLGGQARQPALVCVPGSSF
jgi:hypothetical protein